MMEINLKKLYKMTGTISLIAAANIIFVWLSDFFLDDIRMLVRHNPWLYGWARFINSVLFFAPIGLSILIIVLCVVLIIRSKNTHFSTSGPICALIGTGLPYSLVLTLITLASFAVDMLWAIIPLLVISFYTMPILQIIGGIKMIKAKQVGEEVQI